MTSSENFYFRVIEDGWLKIPAVSYYFGADKVGENDRLLIGLNQLFIQMSGKKVLIDTGLGDKIDYLQHGLLDYQKPRRMLAALKELDVSAPDIDVVVLTHLHFDHSGGGTRIKEGSGLAPTFTNALYYVQKSELAYAQAPDEARAGDYIASDFEPLIESGQLVVIDGDDEIIPNLTIHLAPGHSPGHQVVTAKGEQTTVFFSGDLFATKEHVNLTVATDFDQDLASLMDERRKWTDLVRKHRWLCVFCHAVQDNVGFI